MGAAVFLRNVVGEAETVFLIRIGPLHRQIDGDVALMGTEIDHGRMQRRLQVRQVLDERTNAALVLENIMPIDTLVMQLDTHAGIKE